MSRINKQMSLKTNMLCTLFLDKLRTSLLIPAFEKKIGGSYQQVTQTHTISKVKYSIILAIRCIIQNNGRQVGIKLGLKIKIKMSACLP
jgi:hypothetical protein